MLPRAALARDWALGNFARRNGRRVAAFCPFLPSFSLTPALFLFLNPAIPPQGKKFFGDGIGFWIMESPYWQEGDVHGVSHAFVGASLRDLLPPLLTSLPNLGPGKALSVLVFTSTTPLWSVSPPVPPFIPVSSPLQVWGWPSTPSATRSTERGIGTWRFLSTMGTAVARKS